MRMMPFVVRRLAGIVPTLLLIVVCSFALVRLSPGSPFAQERALDPAVRAALDSRYGLDLPLGKQLGRYIVALAHGDLGPSIKYPQHTVAELIGTGLPHTLALGGVALVWGLSFGLTLAFAGTYANLHGAPSLAALTGMLATVALSLPSFVLGPLLVLLFALVVPLLPPAGWGEVRHLVLPGLTLGTLLAAHVARLTQGTLAGIMNQEYVRTARAKGCGPWRVLWRHMLVPGIMPLVSYMGPATAGLLVGSVAVERIFCVPGIGAYVVDAAINRDYFLVMGIVVLESVLLLMLGVMVDVALAWLDPRVRPGT